MATSKIYVTYTKAFVEIGRGSVCYQDAPTLLYNRVTREEDVSEQPRSLVYVFTTFSSRLSQTLGFASLYYTHTHTQPNRKCLNKESPGKLWIVYTHSYPAYDGNSCISALAGCLRQKYNVQGSGTAETVNKLTSSYA